MAITPLGNAIFINQNTQVAAAKQGDFQARLDAQNLIAGELASEEKEEIAEIRPTEESYKIDPENEHEKKKHQEQNQKNQDDKNDEEGQILDIKI